jgi:type IV pilus assembly protein PilQ
MSFDGALLKDVLLLFSQQSGLNFIASQEVESRKVTVYFENVTPRDALDSIVTANGLNYSKKSGSDIFVVYPESRTTTIDLVTKVIRLKYMRLSSSPLDIGGQVTVGDLRKSSADTNAVTSDAGSASSDSSAGSSLTTSVSDLGSGSRGADRIVQKLLSSQGKVTMDLGTNSLIVTDTKESIAAIEKVLEELDVPPSQVILEVHIMEVSKNFINNIGVEWGGANGALGTVTGGVRSSRFPFNHDFLRGSFDKESPNSIAVNPLDSDSVLEGESGDLPAPNQLSFGTIDATNFSATLHAIQNDNKTKILARPRVLTQNNEAAAIKLVTNAAIGENTNTNAATGAETTEAERSEIGVTMRMTPQINPDDTVSLFLEPAVSTVQSSNFTDGRADPTTRLVRTMARVKNDQTLVIGGLIDSQADFRRRKIPFLGDIPVIGKAFHYDADNEFDRELLVFITPHIVRGPTSAGPTSATARGEDTAVRRMLDQFMEKEMDSMSGTFENFEKTKREFFTKEEELVRDSERRYSNPVVEQQMTAALDALSPQVVDSKISQALDTLNPKK